MSSHPSWKKFETRMAKLLGGKRRGAYTGNGWDGGKSDVILEGFSIECKLLGAPSFSDIRKACKQAEENAEPGQIPVAIVKRKSLDDQESLVCMRLETFLAWMAGVKEKDDGSGERKRPADPGDDPGRAGEGHG